MKKPHDPTIGTTFVSCYSFKSRGYTIYRAFRLDQPWVRITEYHATLGKAMNAARSGLR